MLFKIDARAGSLHRVQSDWAPAELELERYLITQAEANVQVMSESVFGEPLLLVRNQVMTKAKKRADILALDRAGNGVIIELKKNAGQLGVETQALQYLADFSKYRGKNFLRQFAGASGVSEETVLGFVGNKVTIEDLNTRNRVILVARSFDETIFSLGEWLSSKGVGVRCISYFPVQVGREQFLSFSIAFDHSPESLYPLTFSSAMREPGIYWHNIAEADQKWWDFLVSNSEIPAGFDNAPGDQGEKLLTGYIIGDRVVAYAAGYGAVGWAVVQDPSTYRLVPQGSKEDLLNGKNRHRRGVQWKAVARRLSDGMPAKEVRRDFGIYHPISTSVSIGAVEGEKLLARLSERFAAARNT